ncbi:MAG: polysaccharide deacetylase family protein [Rhizobiales bacterium]|nr:polysaccharide deacetylase family protein [Hyphomicrobiales bacterium]MBO6697898.1 polysaccharide deacetylase family protein [Hyphomicrobiales bacterium]MBO6735848.1 polysaccharide deacetylase family protein [Hyphomicrobiales bacterium]MBO6913859.1 polysaccharide deacetylase family protein [Hyphomicrobiales bacterium]MBO6955562.1 polysaccharide deacetylase family protein [Hyphomicrobiales bacterium]
MDASRDLIGYGRVTPDILWPNGSRLAVSVVVNFEEGAEWQVGDGDPVSEPMGEVMSVVAPGTRDMGQEQIFAYGMRAGFWRFMDALSHYEFPATFFCCGQAVERAPELARQITDQGHEAACHGWRWRPQTDYETSEDEGADLDRAIAAIQAATGRKPTGFFCRGSESVWTRGLLAERGFLYTSNAFDDDLPYTDPDHPDLLIVPYALDSNDMKFFHPNGFVRSRDMEDYVEDALATLLREADAGKSRLLNIGFHLRICGRPARFQAVWNILKLLKRNEDRIWIATREDIARAFLAARS